MIKFYKKEKTGIINLKKNTKLNITSLNISIFINNCVQVYVYIDAVFKARQLILKALLRDR